MRSPADLGFSVDAAALPGHTESPEMPDAEAEAAVASSSKDDDVPEVEMEHELFDEAGDAGFVLIEHQGADAAGAQASLGVRQEGENPDRLPAELDVQGVVVRPSDSSDALKTLRQACELCGIGKSGGKATVHKRLASYVAKYDLELKARPSDQGVVPNAVAPVREPSIAEQRLHELIHLPCQSWCKFCVQHKARNDAHEAVDSTECALSVVSFDFGFTGRDESSPDDKLVFLAVHDSHTGWREWFLCPGMVEATRGTTSLLSSPV